MIDLAVLIPTRGRPDNIRKVIGAWDFTNAWDHADMILIVDADDPEIRRYHDLVAEYEHPDTGEPLVYLMEMPEWMPMVHKLNRVAITVASAAALQGIGGRAIGFAGDDHLPQTIGWAARYLTVLRELGTGMVYGDDGYQGQNLSTEWAVTADAVRALGRMVPAPVEHMYCDNSMMDLFGAAGALRHLPEVRIEHMHPIAGKAETDDQYKRVNHRDQFKKDRAAYESWRGSVGMATDIEAVRKLRSGLPDVRSNRTVKRLSPGSAPRRVNFARTRGIRTMGRNSPFPRHFKQVIGATPEDIMLALADFAASVPVDQEIVELGVYMGRTALSMAWGAQQGNGAHVTAIDAWDLEGNTYGPPFTDPGTRRWAAHWVQSLGYANHIRLIQAFAADVAETWDEAGDAKPVGLLFVDDDHSYEGARQAIENWAPHLADDAVIAVDDYGHPDWPGVKEAVDALVAAEVLAPIQVFHERLAVTRLAEAAGERSQRGPVTAITGEGVTPSPYPAVGDQVAVTVDLGAPPLTVGPVNTESGPPEGWVQAGDGSWSEPPVVHPVTRQDNGTLIVENEPDEVDRLFDGPDTSPSTDPGLRVLVSAGELEDVAEGTPITELTIPHLKDLAKKRGIVLGARKDKRSEIIEALKAGR